MSIDEKRYVMIDRIENIVAEAMGLLRDELEEMSMDELEKTYDVVMNGGYYD